MSYVGKLFAKSQPIGLGHVNFQFGASNRALAMQQQMFDQQMMQQMMYWQMANQPQYTVHTHENQKHGGLLGGLWDFTTSALGAYTGQQIGGYTDTFYTSGGFGGYPSTYSFSSGNWGSSIGSLLGGSASRASSGSYRPSVVSYNQGAQTPVAATQARTAEADAHKTECNNLKNLTGYSVIYQDGKFMATSKDGTTSIEESTFADMRDALLADKRANATPSTPPEATPAPPDEEDA